jgi:ACS family hexuronate transporter-like MFS transporter
MPVSLFIVALPLSLAILFFSAAMFAHQFWSATVQSLPADLFPSNMVGSVEGLLGSAGSFVALFFGLRVGWLVERHGYQPAILIVGILHPLAFLVIQATVKDIERLRSERATCC